MIRDIARIQKLKQTNKTKQTDAGTFHLADDLSAVDADDVEVVLKHLGCDHSLLVMRHGKSVDRELVFDVVLWLLEKSH